MLVFAATAPRVRRPATTPASPHNARKVTGRRRANDFTSAKTSLGSRSSSHWAISPPFCAACWARSVNGPDSADPDAIPVSSCDRECTLAAIFCCCDPAWSRTSLVTDPSRFFACAFVSATTLAASSLAVAATFLPASTAVSFTAVASPLATSAVLADVFAEVAVWPVDRLSAELPRKSVVSGVRDRSSVGGYSVAEA